MEKIETWEDLEKAYRNVERDEMTHDEEKEYVDICFDLYEKEGFAEKFWTPYDDGSEYYIGWDFTVIGRVEEKDRRENIVADIATLPMWKIRFGNGDIINAYPEEIVEEEMIKNGCPFRELQDTYMITKDQMRDLIDDMHDMEYFVSLSGDSSGFLRGRIAERKSIFRMLGIEPAVYEKKEKK